MLFLIKLSLKDIKHCSLTWHTKYSEHNLTINIKYCSTIHNKTYKNLMMYTAVCPLYFSKPILHIMVSVLSFFLTLLFFFFLLTIALNLGVSLLSSYLILDGRIPTSTHFLFSPSHFPLTFCCIVFVFQLIMIRLGFFSCHYWIREHFLLCKPSIIQYLLCGLLAQVLPWIVT